VAKKTYDAVSTKPVKRFFVEMLTRDISLEDAILDLLDNCVDGIQRNLTAKKRNSAKPYDTYRVDISIDGAEFRISDNCGGIPWSEHDRAFRMGRPRQSVSSSHSNALLVGAYGIGMKRAIFKMGLSAKILTKTTQDDYEVVIPKNWSEEEENWDLNVVVPNKKLTSPGTQITIKDLTKSTADRFKSTSFFEILIEKIETHYAVILTKGLAVAVNKKLVSPKRIAVKFAEIKAKEKTAIRPYIFRSEVEENLEVFVAVGIREPIPDAEVILSEQEATTFSTDYAGWTIICNDRVVLYCNRDELTGWGTANIPRYHTQFIAISGFVEFKGDPAKLPTTTTKRGLEFSSSIYQQVLNRMREGTRMFVDYTNWWKQSEPTAREQVLPLPSKTLSELKTDSQPLKFSSAKTGLKGQIYKPDLPRPINTNPDVRISFFRSKKKVWKLAEQLLDDFEDIKEKDVPRILGETLFDREAKNRN